MDARFRIAGVDYEPQDLASQLPLYGVLLRRIAGPDRPDYWLAELDEPISWCDEDTARTVTHLVLAARYEGQTIEPGFERLTVGIAYVTDLTLLSDEKLEFKKCRYVAIGIAEGRQ